MCTGFRSIEKKMLTVYFLLDNLVLLATLLSYRIPAYILVTLLSVFFLSTTYKI